MTRCAVGTNNLAVMTIIYLLTAAVLLSVLAGALIEMSRCPEGTGKNGQCKG